MKTIMAVKSPHDISFSFSRRYFHWKKKTLDEDDEEEILNFSNSSSHLHEEIEEKQQHYDYDHYHRLTLKMAQEHSAIISKKKSKLKSVFMVFTTRVPRLTPSYNHSVSLGTRVVGTLFGHRRGHVNFAFQENAKLAPAFLIELATPTSVLVREMASGLVRIALECEKKRTNTNTMSLLEEPLWRTYCNGRKCGYANKRECGAEEWKILKSLGPISMGAGVLPGNGVGSEEGDVMYMRAKYERVVGSKDSEAFYMMNPDGSGGPELSIYFIRV